MTRRFGPRRLSVERCLGPEVHSPDARGPAYTGPHVPEHKEASRSPLLLKRRNQPDLHQ